MKEKLKTVGYIFLMMVGLVSLISACGDEEKTTETEQVEKVKDQDAKKKSEEQANKEAEEAKKKAEEEAAKKKAEEQAAKKKAEAEVKAKEDAMLAVYKSSLASMGSVAFDEKNKAFLITPTDEDFITDLFAILTGTLDISYWDDLVDSFVQMSVTQQQNLGSGYQLGLINPANTENIILIVSDGVVYLDAFNE